MYVHISLLFCFSYFQYQCLLSIEFSISESCEENENWFKNIRMGVLHKTLSEVRIPLSCSIHELTNKLFCEKEYPPANIRDIHLQQSTYRNSTCRYSPAYINLQLSTYRNSICRYSPADIHLNIFILLHVFLVFCISVLNLKWYKNLYVYLY